MAWLSILPGSAVCTWQLMTSSSSMTTTESPFDSKNARSFAEEAPSFLSVSYTHLAHPYGKFGILFQQFFIHGIILLFLPRGTARGPFDAARRPSLQAFLKAREKFHRFCNLRHRNALVIVVDKPALLGGKVHGLSLIHIFIP